jgi:hypothetical protein
VRVERPAVVPGFQEISGYTKEGSETLTSSMAPSEGAEQPTPKLRQAAVRYGWGLADQIFSSLTNFALAIIVVRTVSLGEFGAFSLVFATYLLGLGASRAIASEPLTVRYSASTHAQWEWAVAQATGAALSAGVGLGLGCLLIAWMTEGTLRQSFAALGLVMPGLLLQDAWRFAFFAAARGNRAFVNDLTWALVLFPTIALLLTGNPVPVGVIILIWGGAATLAGLVGAFQASVVPRPLATIQWIREQRRLVPPFLAEFTASSGAAQLVLYAAGAVSLAAAGALRAGQVLLGPFNVFLMGIRLAVLPEAVRAARRSESMLFRITVVVAIVLALAAIGWGTLVYFLPARLGTAVLGPSWQAAHNVVLPLAFASAASGVITGATVGLRSLTSARRSLRARLLTGTLIVPSGVAGAALHGALGAAVGLAVGTSIASIWWWFELTRALRAEAPAFLRRDKTIIDMDIGPDA